MLGAIIGDIVGSRFESRSKRIKRTDFELFTKDNKFTDDTVFTIAVADWLIRDKGNNPETLVKLMQTYGRMYPRAGFSTATKAWINSDRPIPYGSRGNGAAMRVSPVAYWYYTLDEVLDAAAATALPSHNHDEGIKGAQTVALAIFKALQFGKQAPEHIDEILDECVQFSGYDINIKKADVINRFDETCQGTVPVALWIIGISDNFEDAVRKAVSLGADADTLGAIVGSIAEAIWGIPEELKQSVMPYLTEEMKEVIVQFYDHLNENKE
jgi:ADP-ribosylglycohydrolase